MSDTIRKALERIAAWKKYSFVNADQLSDYETGANDAIDTLAEIARAALSTPSGFDAGIGGERASIVAEIMLRRLFAVVTSTQPWRDKTGLRIDAHPLVDEVREYLRTLNDAAWLDYKRRMAKAGNDLMDEIEAAADQRTDHTAATRSTEGA